MSDELKAVENRVIELVVGWTHPDASSPVDYVGERLANVSAASVTWEVRLRCAYRLRMRGESIPEQISLQGAHSALFGHRLR